MSKLDLTSQTNCWTDNMAATLLEMYLGFCILKWIIVKLITTSTIGYVQGEESLIFCVSMNYIMTYNKYAWSNEKQYEFACCIWIENFIIEPLYRHITTLFCRLNRWILLYISVIKYVYHIIAAVTPSNISRSCIIRSFL